MAYFRCTTGGSGKGNTLVVTCADDLAGATITCTNGTKTYTKTCPSTSPYEVTFYGLEAGTWTVSATVSGDTYTTTVVITDYEAELGGFNWKTWVDLSKNYTSSDFTDLDDLLSDETAVRELMTIHDCVDYLADIATTSADVETIIGNDLCAKWINNRDYALDTLYANTIIADYMDAADKYFYGEWALVGQVPTMTSNTAPYGEASASSQTSSTVAPWKAFDGITNDIDSSKWAANTSVGTTCYLTYKSVTPIRVSAFKVYWPGTMNTTYKIQGSNDNFVNDVHDLTDSITDDNSNTSWSSTVSYPFYHTISDNTASYQYHRIYITAQSGDVSKGGQVIELQFYAWQPKGNVPVMTSNTAPYGSVNAGQSMYSGEEAYKAFDGNPSTWASMASSATEGSVGYRFVNPVNVRKVYIGLESTTAYTNYTYKVQYSDDGSNYTSCSNDFKTVTQANPYIDVDDFGYHIYWRIIRHSNSAAGGLVQTLQFYGRELSVSVPVMTGNTTPYGEASASSGNTMAWYAFRDSIDATHSTSTQGWEPDSDGNGAVGYDFGKDVNIKFVKIYNNSTSNLSSAKIIGTNDSTWEDVESGISVTSRAFNSVQINDGNKSFKKWRLSGSVITGGQGYFLQFYGLDYSEKEFEEGTAKKWLYDHGVKVSGLTSHVTTNGTVTDDGETLLLKINGGSNYHAIAYSTEDLSDYSLFRVKVGKECYSSQNSSFINIGVLKDPLPSVGLIGSNLDANVAFGGSYNLGVIPNNLSVDITAFNESRMIGVFCSTAGTLNMWADVKEMWLE